MFFITNKKIRSFFSDYETYDEGERRSERGEDRAEDGGVAE